MKKIINTAKSFAVKLAAANHKVYLKFIELNNKIQALSMDIYDEMDPKFLSAAQEMSKKVLLATDKIYRQGMSLSEMQFLLSDLKSKLTNLMINPQVSKFTQQELSKLKSVVDSIVPMDVPAQAPSKAISKPGDAPESTPKVEPDFGASKPTPKASDKWIGIDPNSYITSEEDDEWDSATYPYPR
jgi:hypothetical protein